MKIENYKGYLFYHSVESRGNSLTVWTIKAVKVEERETHFDIMSNISQEDAEKKICKLIDEWA